MLYPKNLEEKLGFDKIRELVKSNCISEMGISFADQLCFSSDYEKISRLIKQTAEFRKLIETRESFPSSDYFDYSGALIKAGKIDAYLSEDEFHNLNLSLQVIDKILKFFRKKSDDYPELAMLAIGLYLNTSLIDEINRVIDERGQIRNNASAQLMDIRQDLQKKQFQVRRILDRIIKNYMSEGYSPDDSAITIRNGRLVLPVKAEFKRKVKGFIHDESASGQTAFIEPVPALEVNNDILDLEYQEKREIRKILTRLTDLVRPEINNLEKCLHFLGLIDFIRAKARVALLLEAGMPQIDKKTLISWKQARHPLLFLSYRHLKKIIIPLDISLDPDRRILIISGPNAGGKSVCLKTVGLIQYMLQCGLLVPMNENSVMGIFQGILIDIGDEQSIENDLSTYSSHLLNMKYFIQYATKKTLLLIDEFGTGTEPQFGGAIAESILDKLRVSRALGVITTHYSNLKKYAGTHEGVINGAMRFNLEKMEPQFILDIGRPGSSFAIEIARNIGLPENILDDAKRKVGFDQVNYERLLGELEAEKRKLIQQNRVNEQKEKELKTASEEYEALKKFIESNKKRILDEAKLQAQEILKETNKSIELTIREIREAQAEKKRTKAAREKLEKTKEKVRITKPAFKEPPKSIQAPEKIAPGTFVNLPGHDTIGQVISVKGNQAEVAVGQLTIKVKLNRLSITSRGDFKSVSNPNSVSKVRGIDISEKMQNFSGTLDLRGIRAEEALKKMDYFLDEALLLNITNVKVIHGKGDGILRKLIRQKLKSYSFISGFEDEHADRGGAGVTLIHIK